jgi:hypothetical protein
MKLLILIVPILEEMLEDQLPARKLIAIHIEEKYESGL